MKIIITAKAKSKISKIKSLNKKKMKQYYDVLYPEKFVNTLTAKSVFASNHDTITKINNIIRNIETLPDSDISSDLFQEKNNKNICLMFFNDIKRLLPNERLESLLSKYNLDENYLELYKKLNASTSPVRNYLILLTLNLHEK